MSKDLSPRRLLTAAAPLLLALVVAFLGGVSALRKIETFQPLGFAAAREAGGWRVEVASKPGTGLERGDLLLLINGQSASSAAAIRSALAAQRESELGVLRGGTLVAVRYLRPGLELDWTYLLLALSGALYLLIGLFTFLKSRRSAGWVFFLWCLSSAAVYLFTTTGRAADAIDRALVLGEDLARLLLPALTVHLFLVFPRRLERWRRLVPFLYLPSAVLATLGVRIMLGAAGTGGEALAAQATVDRLGLYWLALAALAALGILWQHLRTTADPEQRQQLRWLAVGLGAGYLPFVALYLVPLAAHVPTASWVVAFAVLPLALVPLSFAYAILRYKLWDIQLIVRETAAYTLTFLLGALGFGLLNLAVGRGIPEEMAQTRTALSFAAGLAIAGVMVPARRRIGSTLARLHYRSSYSKRLALAELGRELLRERDLDTLCAALLEHLEVSLELDRTNLYLIQRESLVAVRPQPNLPPQLAPAVLADEEWAADVVPISGLDELGGPAPALSLFQAGFRYAFPLAVRENRIGLLLTSYRLDEVPLSSEDVDLIRQVLNQVALAIENAQLLDQLHHQLDEVMRLQRYSEGIIESSPAGLAVLATDDRVLSCNLAFAALAGAERRLVVGRPFAEVLPVALPGPAVGTSETRYHRQDGEERHLQLSVAELGAGPVPQRIVVVQDVTHRVEMEQTLKEKERLASLGMLAAGVAHEVNTPITGISSYAQLLLDETPEDDPRHGLLRKMERQTFRAARIVSSLLEFARNRRSEQRSVALGAVVSNALEELGERLAECKIDLFWAPPGSDVNVFGCETELVQVFVNLITNAMDAMRSGGTLRVDLTVAGERVQVSLADTGPGIPDEQLAKIFQPFFSTKLAEGGTGLGLSISYEIVRRHGGEIAVESTPGQGSRFTVALPLEAPAERVAS